MKTWSYRDCVSGCKTREDRVIRFLRHKWLTPKKVDMSQSDSDEEMSYQSYEMICRLLYALMIAQLREDSVRDIDKMERRYGEQWRRQLKPVDLSRYGESKKIEYIGEFNLPEHIVNVYVPDFV